jgi:transglutaminase-like putative cysteine protease
MRFSVGCELHYRIAQPCSFVLQIEAAKADGQIVEREALTLPEGARREIYADPVSLNRTVRTVLPQGTVTIRYEADVTLDETAFDPAVVSEYDFDTLPMAYLRYMAPSRYCPSDLFTEFAFQQFGKLPRGHQRVSAVADWVHDNVAYKAGSTGPNTTAAEVFQAKSGVCRDFAHLGISLCRALGIPARYASAYAHGLSPQDFHAVFQAYLTGPRGGAWYTFDASHMSSADAIVRIAAGEDAASVAFAWPQGVVEYDPPRVWVDSAERELTARTTQAVPVP